MENFGMDHSEGVRQCIIVTGMSGAGKTTALKVLEDQGFFAIDNIPPTLLPQLFRLLSGHRAAVHTGIAATIDIRSERLPQEFDETISWMKQHTHNVKTVFLNASDETLLSRFEQTRRPHPLGDQSVQEGIRRERLLMSPILENADIVIDTSLMDAQQYRKRLIEEFCREPGGVSLILTSFGFKYGVPQDGNYVFDVRFLPNPFYVPDLKILSGKDQAVNDYLNSFPETGEFLDACVHFLRYVVPHYLKTGKSQLHVAVGCTGGRHRSVAVVERLYELFKNTPGGVSVHHRDVEKVQAL